MSSNACTTSIRCPLVDPRTGLLEPGKADLLSHYARKNPTRFLQIDGFNPATGVLEDLEDLDRDEILALRKTELMNGADPVRVLIKPGADAETVSRILGKIAEWIGHKPEALDDDYLAVTEDSFPIINMGRISPRRTTNGLPWDIPPVPPWRKSTSPTDGPSGPIADLTEKD